MRCDTDVIGSVSRQFCPWVICTVLYIQHSKLSDVGFYNRAWVTSSPESDSGFQEISSLQNPFEPDATVSTYLSKSIVEYNS